MMTTAVATTGPLPRRVTAIHNDDIHRRQHPNDEDHVGCDRVAPPPPHINNNQKKKRKMISSCENIPSRAVATTTTTTTVSRNIMDYLFQRATTGDGNIVRLHGRDTRNATPPPLHSNNEEHAVTLVPDVSPTETVSTRCHYYPPTITFPNIPWCIPSNLQFHPLPPNATTQILNIRFVASADDSTSTKVGGQIAICYRSLSSPSSSHCQVAIYQWNTILQATIVGRQKMIRDIILMMTMTTQETNTTTTIQDDPSLHRLITTIQPDLCFPIVVPSSSSSNNNNNSNTANALHDRLIIFEYASIGQNDAALHLIVGFHRHSSLLVYHLSAMLHHHHPRLPPPQSNWLQNGSDQFCTQLRTHGSGVQAQIDSKSKLIVVATDRTCCSHNNRTTIVLSTGRWIMGWNYHPKRASSQGQRRRDMIPYHWQFQYGTDAFSTITQLPNHHSNGTVQHDNSTDAARAALLVVGTSGGTFIVLNMDQLHYPSMSCTLSPTIVHAWISFRNTTSCQSNMIGDWLNYEQRHYKQRSNHNVNNVGSQGLGIRALTILPEMYLPSARQPSNDYKMRYRFVWITMNGWILSTHIEVTTTTGFSNVATMSGSTTTTIHVRRKSKAPYYDGICHVHYAIKPIVYRNSTDHSLLIHPPQPTWNYLEHYDEATSSFPVSVSSHGILWYNPLDQDKYTSPQPLPQLPNPDVRVLSSNRSINIVGRTAAESTTTTSHDSMTQQKPKSRRQHAMVPKLNYISFDQIRRQSLKSRSHCNNDDDANNEVSISRIRARKPTTPNQHPTCIWMHPDRPLEHILVGTPDCGLYLIESKTKIQVSCLK